LDSSGRRLWLDRPPAAAQASGLAASELPDGFVDSPVSLRYPNGRVHEATVSNPGELRLGDRFELYGRRWSAVELLKVSRWRGNEPRRMLCVSSGMTAPTQ